MENEAITPESVAAAVAAAQASMEEQTVTAEPAIETPVAVEETPAVEVVPEAIPVETPEVVPEVSVEPVPVVDETPVEVPEVKEEASPDILSNEEMASVLAEEGVEPEPLPVEETVETEVPAVEEVPVEVEVPAEVEALIDETPASEEPAPVKKDTYADKIEKIEAKILKHKAEIEELELQKTQLIKEQLGAEVKSKIDDLSLDELEKLKDELK